MSRTPEPSSEQLAGLSEADAAIVRAAFHAFEEMETAPPVPESLQRRMDAEAGAPDAGGDQPRPGKYAETP